MIKNFLILSIISLYLFVGCKDSSSDPAINKIETVIIGNQVWMLKNLDVDNYLNGDPIPEVKDSIQWSVTTTGAWCYIHNNDSLGAIYGKLYNYYALTDPRGIVPEGYHIASDSEWVILQNLYGGIDSCGGKLKEAGTAHWRIPNNYATNESGFSALPGGYREYNGTFMSFGYYGYWWTGTMYNTLVVWYKRLGYTDSGITRAYKGVGCGYSVRCIKNN